MNTPRGGIGITLPDIKTRLAKRELLALSMFFCIILLMATVSFAHGPKGHTEGFTALAAAKKATLMYDKLVATGKLDESWETKLETIVVYERNTGQQEIVVKFSRTSGEPRAVYIFFTEQGKYNGSNFTGK